MPPARRASPHLQPFPNVWQPMPETVNQIPEVRSGLSLGRIGPQHEGKVLARLRRLPMQEEICQQRLNPWRAGSRQWSVADTDSKPAEQHDSKRPQIRRSGVEGWRLRRDGRRRSVVPPH
jgi:hypothetical protein